MYDQNGRPTFGFIVMYPIFFTESVKMGTALHELIHILGFASDMYTNFIDPSTGQRYTASNQFTETRTFNGVTKTIAKLRFPTALTAARQYFNCSTLNGVELEETGGAGTAGSHWDQRILLDDVMSPSNVAANPGVRCFTKKMLITFSLGF